MSLTSYRAAPPRDCRITFPEREREGCCGPGGDLLFRTLGCSTIGAEGFHGRVRDGIGCLAPRHGHQAGNAWPPGRPPRLPWLEEGRRSGGLSCEEGGSVGWAAGRGLAAARGRLVRKRGLRGDRALIRAISTGQLNGLPRFHLRPIDVVVFHGSRRDLVLRRVSRLDAFSGYPVRT